MRARELGAALNWDRSRLSHLVGRMEKRSLLTREECAEDARGLMVRLTDAGRAVVRDAAPDHSEAIRRYFFNPLSSVKDRIGASMIESLEAQADPVKIAGVSNSYLFDIEGDGQWLVDVRDGAVTVTEGAGDADATISTSSETFDKLAAGNQNPVAAYMTGKLKIKGDMGAAMKLQKLF